MLMFADGSVEAFETLFERHRGSVYRFARSVLADPSAAEEVLQDVFLAIVRSAKRYEPKGLFKAYLMRITRNTCLTRLEGERLRREMAAQFGRMEEPQTAAADRGDDDRLAAVRRALRRLPDRQREAVMLHAFEQMTYQQIADVLDTPINTVKTLIHRGRAALAERLNGQSTENDDGV